MIYFFMCLCEILYICWSYLFIKTYQLCGYKPTKFLDNVLSFNLSFGDKNKLVFTKRIIRFSIVFILLSFALFFLIFYFISNVYLIILDVILLFLFMPIVILLAHYIIWPIEKSIFHFYIFKATKKLKKKNIIKIGITGSFGKTSTKNILTAMLEKEYKVCATPKNYNTEMGLTKTILSSLDDHDVFIAEMGARRRGNIKTLTKMVNPSYAILTTIGEQHIETFKTLANIEDTKYELPENMPPSSVVVFNGDSDSNIRLYNRYKGEKFLTSKTGSYAYADNIEISEEGSTFDLYLDGKCLKAKTNLLGKCNIDNIVTASALAHILGISDKDLISAIKDLEHTKHRLELMKNNGLIIIDDSYNSNILGAKEALDVLSKFKGRKIVITPGLVELGALQSKSNFLLGTYIADVADYIIIMNNVNKNELLSGAISHNFNRDHIFFADSRKKQKELLGVITSSDSVILFENDLPDNYK